jgi:hypothetical protein
VKEHIQQDQQQKEPDASEEEITDQTSHYRPYLKM